MLIKIEIDAQDLCFSFLRRIFFQSYLLIHINRSSGRTSNHLKLKQYNLEKHFQNSLSSDNVSVACGLLTHQSKQVAFTVTYTLKRTNVIYCFNQKKNLALVCSADIN